MTTKKQATKKPATRAKRTKADTEKFVVPPSKGTDWPPTFSTESQWKLENQGTYKPKSSYPAVYILCTGLGDSTCNVQADSMQRLFAYGTWEAAEKARAALDLSGVYIGTIPMSITRPVRERLDK